MILSNIKVLRRTQFMKHPNCVILYLSIHSYPSHFHLHDLIGLYNSKHGGEGKCWIQRGQVTCSRLHSQIGAIPDLAVRLGIYFTVMLCVHTLAGWAQRMQTETAAVLRELQCVDLWIRLLGLGPASATHCWTLHKLLNRSVPQFSYL